MQNNGSNFRNVWKIGRRDTVIGAPPRSTRQDTRQRITVRRRNPNVIAALEAIGYSEETLRRWAGI